MYFWAIMIYLLILIGVGCWRSRQVATQEDFVVAGRKLSAKVLVGTLLATWIGTGSIMGGAGLGYERGFPALWFSVGVWAALIVMYFVAGRARRFGQFTVPDILEARYNKYARILGTIVTVIAYTTIVSYQFRAGGKVLNIVADIPLDTGIIITAAFVIGYTVLAGMISVAYTDVVNGIFMVLGLVVLLPFLTESAGGWATIVERLPDSHFQVLGSLSVMEAIALALPAMLLLMGESGMYQRFFSARSPATARRAVVGWVIGTVCVETLILVIAVVGSSIFPDIDGETVILVSIKEALPPVIGCLAVAAVAAVIVSTADSFLLVPSTSLMRDIYQRFINPDVAPARFVLYSRIVIVVLGVVAWAQLRFFESILEMALYAYTMYGAGVTPAVMGAFFWKRATAAGGVSAIAAGMIVTLVWEIFGLANATIWQSFDLETLPTVYPALAVSLGCLIFVSLATPPPDEAKWKPFFS
jgi:SSS family solute:Na+ symporter/sodium/proline symporter